MQRVYLDNSASTRVDPAVVVAMLPYFTELFGNASSKHSYGAEVAGAVRAARQQIVQLIGAGSGDEIVFTSGGTESDHAAILSALETQTGRDEIIVSAVEHPAVLALCDHLEKTRNIKIKRIGVDAQGRLDIQAYHDALSPKTAIASIMWANNETGTLFPVERLAAMAREAGALFHTDAVQAVGKAPVNVNATAIDMLSISAHKLHGPKVVGALYVRKGVKYRPNIFGGRQERGRRAGTENVPGIVGFGKAAELAAIHIWDQLTRVQSLRNRLEMSLTHLIDGAVILGDVSARIASTSCMAFSDIESDAILTLLDQKGIAASAGSACASGAMEPSHVLRAMRVPFTLAHGAIRFSLSRDNCDADIDLVLDAMPAIVKKLRRRSVAEERESMPHIQPRSQAMPTALGA